MASNNLIFSEKIFIAGAHGMVGSSIQRILKRYGYGKDENSGKLFTPTRLELDLSNSEDVENWFKINRPTIVINAAAKVV